MKQINRIFPTPNDAKSSYVAILRYQKPHRVTMYGKRKTSPKFETLYGLLYWLNKQDYTMEYMILNTKGEEIIREGFKKQGETIV
jgi:hypothetical protein